MNMPKQSTSEIFSRAAQSFAVLLDDAIKEVAGGQRLAFVLLVEADSIAQYISNVKRSDAKALMMDLLERWRDGTWKEYPAHENPELGEHYEQLVRVVGVSRVAGDDKGLLVSFDKRPTDEMLRELHESLTRKN